MLSHSNDLATLTEGVVLGRMDTYQAADELLEIFGRIKP
jgi:hypothetical protein